MAGRRVLMVLNNSVTSFYQCTALTIPILATLLQLKYQGTDSPFLTHPRTMRVAASGAAIYYLACIALVQYPHRLIVMASHICLNVSGYSSVASLASLLLPAPIRVYIYSIFVLISALELWYYYKRVMHHEEGGFQAFRRRLHNLCTLAANSFGQRFRSISRFSGRLLPL